MLHMFNKAVSIYCILIRVDQSRGFHSDCFKCVYFRLLCSV